ncbi:hypothetical protein F5878DRAFT_669445 [Lentinula raphanica]|uniref:RING-type domain-containing protein n=1 Tax=Lentinula raphanica TaxID=153919 RepID=A0AA38PEJ6_9AGAR|nr:hypothetical protein F5878DRAFT_669445 [Lentinula raphanica]
MNDLESALINSFIDSLPHLDKSNAAKDSCCPICLSSFETLDAASGGITRLPACKHMFCRNDLIKWIQAMNGSCPTCRNVFLNIRPLNAIEESAIGYDGISNEIDDYEEYEEYEEEDDEYGFSDVEHYEEYILGGEHQEHQESADDGHYYHPVDRVVSGWEDPAHYSFGEGVGDADHSHEVLYVWDDPAQHSFGGEVDDADHSHEVVDADVWEEPAHYSFGEDVDDTDHPHEVVSAWEDPDQYSFGEDVDDADHSHAEYDGGEPETFHDDGDISDDEDLDAALHASLNLHYDTDYYTPDNEEHGDVTNEEEVNYGYGYCSYADEGDEYEQHEQDASIQGGEYFSDEDQYPSDHDDGDGYYSNEEYSEFGEGDEIGW